MNKNKIKFGIICGIFVTIILAEFIGFKLVIKHMNNTIDKRYQPKLDTIEQRIYDRHRKMDKYIEKADKRLQEFNKKVEKVNIQNETLKQMFSRGFPHIQAPTVKCGGSSISIKHMGKFRITAYCLNFEDCGKSENNPEYGITASMTHVREWQTIAMDKSIPMGTVVYIPYFKDKPNHGIFIKEDHGGAIYGNRIDVYMKSNKMCNKFGVQYLDVYIINNKA